MNSEALHTLQQEAIELLKQLIATPSFSKLEDRTAAIIEQYLQSKDVRTQRSGNNVFGYNKHFDPARPTILLNSHHDTVKPNPGYTRDPFSPDIVDGKLYGLGSNDAGGALAALIASFLFFSPPEALQYNLAMAAT